VQCQVAPRRKASAPCRPVILVPLCEICYMTSVAAAQVRAPSTSSKLADVVLQVRPGQSTLAFYTAENISDKVITGVSTYNVAPPQAGAYFNKIQCFCFEAGHPRCLTYSSSAKTSA